MNRVLLPFVLLLAACQPAEEASDAPKLSYAETRKADVVDNYFGTEVADPYRWLEDDLSEETADWVGRQNDVTFGYLEQIPYREALRDRLQASWNYPREGAPEKYGDYEYFTRNDGLQDQDVVYRRNSEGVEAIFLDPNTLSDDGTTSLAELEFSTDGSLAAYAISEGGSDWRKIFVMNAETGEILEEPLVDVKFSGIAWYGQEGFFYSRYEKPDGSELSAKVDQHLLYYHRVGTDQSEDDLVYGGTEEEKHRYIFADVSEDDRYLIVYGANSTSGSDVRVKQLPDGDLITLVPHLDGDYDFLDNDGDTLLFETNFEAPNTKVVSVSITESGVGEWQDVIPESEHVLFASVGAGYLFTEYMIDAISTVVQYSYAGERIRDVALPGIGTTGTLAGKSTDAVIYYSFTNYKTPSTLYAYDPASGESTTYRRSESIFDSDSYESKQVFYASKDGTRVPMIITHRKGLVLDGTNPTILYGYGGFNISVMPRFSIVNSVWLEQGGVYAVPNIRGGGEYGKAWHLAGTKQQKQNVFDDFIAAAEYLIEEKYTSSEYLAISGGSNGGLLVGAVMTQRPDLIKVALPAVGVLDMLRYHTFTAGAGWAYDYGTSEDDADMFNYLLGYSPLHNIQAGVEYPATLVTTADHDDRVVPAHSFKFAAELQSKQAGSNPTLIRIETKAGHGAGTPVSKIIEGRADVFAFTLHNMGIAQLPEQVAKESD